MKAPTPIAVLPLFWYKKIKTDTVVSTVSHNKDWQHHLSPFVLGPCNLYNGYTAQNVENAWQYSKVYGTLTTSDGDPAPSYFRWANRGWCDPVAHRYPMGKGAVPEYSYWNGKKLGYIQARKVIYAPLYAEAVQRTAAFRKLKKLYKEAKRLVLLDFDAYDHAAQDMTLTDVLNEPKRKMGHAFVLAMLLLNDPALKQLKLRT